ncbi:hypothetical protein LUD75_15180 [Epilithonimonas sp. JDS]|uniref:hypothetical protein n=1 Tax=Epilithonimonas sp. JDS TaxID=2902797 RepID=UPI001E5A1FBA|nr:hypothetical protein [Epilithonimonas sp. JDS]MCD9856067.1 hypothetical protein [Epilithonimonas sp. JDS]
MKKFYLMTLAMAFSLDCAQVAIGKTTLESASSSVEFGSENRGLVLPWTTSSASVVNVVNGTLIFDINEKKTKIYTANTWKDLTVESNGAVDTSLQDGLTEQTGAKISVGTVTSTPGILVLEDTNRAMILPKVANAHLNIIAPTAGMLVYDTAKKMLLVYNGTVWTFWKAS